jgi:hypothetical protein
MIRAAQYSYAALAWALVVAIVLQVFFIGLGLFANAEYVSVHADFGWILHLAPVLLVVAAAAAGAGRARILWAIALAIVIWLVPILAVLRDGAPLVAAFHPLVAVSAFLLAVAVAVAAFRLARDGGTSTTTVWQWLLVAAVVVLILVLSFSGSPEAA